MATSKPTFFSPLKDQKVIAIAAFLTIIYILIQVYGFNYRFITETLSGTFPFLYKAQVLGGLITGYFVMFPLLTTIFNLLAAILVGINLTLLIALTQKGRHTGEMKMTLGGSSLLAVVSAGCPSCGITLLSFLGPSSSVISFFLASPIVLLGILIILLASIIYNLYLLQKSLSCALPSSFSRKKR
ncbi:MAG TPA: hypothetical protein VG935_01015 [Patescibacteria group bacterium]|nr:hypothetical protein [Patescibacteria group bacterium]